MLTHRGRNRLLAVTTAKPAASAPSKPTPLFDDDLFAGSDAGSAMGASDIADYLAAASSGNPEDVELF